MKGYLSRTVLKQENQDFRGSGGRSEENRGSGFRPAFMDLETLAIHESRFADGRLAPVHVLDGLPDALVVARSATGKVLAVKASVVSGFVREARFYNRDEAARCESERID